MARVHDVAAYILSKNGSMTAFKLQKLAYYSQAWSLIWDEKPLFRARIEAWANGPVIPALYRIHRGQFKVRPPWPGGIPSALSENERETIEAVLEYYGDKSSQWLSELTHQERPWKEARRGIAPGEPSNREITQAALAEFYGSL